MKFTLQLCIEDGNSTSIIEEFYSLEREDPSFENIGMNLSESKELLKNFQTLMIEKQIKAYIQDLNLQGYQKKGSYMIQLKTLFGDIMLKSPRFYTPGERKATFSPLKKLLTTHVTPELLYLETKWASLIPFEKTANLLKEVLPVSETLNASTIQNHLNKIVSEQEAQLPDGQFMYDSGSILYRKNLPRPERTMIVGMDGGYLRDWNQKKNIFEVIVGKTVPAERDAKCFGFVGSYDQKPKRRIYEHLQSQGMLPHQKLEFLSDGAPNLRSMQNYLNAESVQILDWFHLTMRITVLNQFALGFSKADKQRGADFTQNLKSIKLNLWHGKVQQALDLIEDFEYTVFEHQEDERIKKKYEKLKALKQQILDFQTYVTANKSFIPNYSERYRYGEVITTSFVESTVNYVIAKRFGKKQSMQWTRKGAHLLLQARTQVLNNDWEKVFREKYPNFRPVDITKNLSAA